MCEIYENKLPSEITLWLTLVIVHPGEQIQTFRADVPALNINQINSYQSGLVNTH